MLYGMPYRVNFVILSSLPLSSRCFFRYTDPTPGLFFVNSHFSANKSAENLLVSEYLIYLIRKVFANYE